jgi:ubiquinone/menaquinone biosynthesis C-methylase UbiE
MLLFKPAGRHRTTLRMLDPQPDDVILNVGCAWGYFEHHYLAGRVKRAVGIDYNEASINFAKEHVEAEFYCASSNALPFAEVTFDKVLCEDTLEHVDDEEGTLREIVRVLKPGGLLVLSVPNDFLNILDREYPEHRHYSAADLRHLLGKHGLTVERVHRSGLLPHVVGLILRFGRTPGLMRTLRRLTAAIENADHGVNLGFGFSIVVTARTKAECTQFPLPARA